MSFVLLGILNSQAAGGGGVAYRLQNFYVSGTGNVEQANAVAVDADGNTYLAINNNNTFEGYVVKVDPSGNILWQRQWNEFVGFVNGIDIDSSNNVYASGWHRYQTSPAVIENGVAAKWNSDGVIQWQRKWGSGITSSSRQTKAESIVADDTGNTYYAGYSDLDLIGYDFWAEITEIAPDGSSQGANSTLTFGKNSSGVNTFGYGVTLNPNNQNELFTTGFTNAFGAGDYDVFIAKLGASNLSISAFKTIGGSSNDSQTRNGVTVDSQGNVIIVFRTESQGSGGFDIGIVKVNSSLSSIVWSNVIGGSGTDFGYGIAVDSQDNVYVVGQTQGGVSGGIDGLIAKYNSSGTLQWQRSIGRDNSTGNDYFYNIKIDSNDNLYVSGEASFVTGGNNAFLAVLPNDGSGTGTYNLDGTDVTYAASSLTASSASFTLGNYTQDNRVVWQNSSTSLQEATGNLTTAQVEI